MTARRLISAWPPEGRDGIDAINRVRTALAHDIPAIVVSGESSAEELARITAAGFMRLHKPVASAMPDLAR